MLVVFSDIISKRLSYVLGIIFEDRNVPYEIINDPDVFRFSEGIKLVYSDYPFEESFPTISPSTLLFEEDIRQHYLSRKEWGREEVISFDGIPDPLASIFYLLSCYDDYLSEDSDQHDRYPVKSSLVYNYGWLDKLMVERWCEEVLLFIEAENKTKIETNKIPFKVIPTFDIDNAFAYRLKEGFRKWMSVSKDLLRFDKKRIRERRRVLKEGVRDPYDTYDIIEGIIEKGYEVKIFWLLGDFGTYDRNVSYENDELRELIKSFSKLCSVGLHPSYQSNDSRSVLLEEKSRIEEIIGDEVTLSRQHFLKLNIPYTYEQLISVGSLNDYTLGFAELPGFRAGIARSFLWYNLKKEIITELNIHPFSYMDGTLNEYMELSTESAKSKIDDLKNEVRKYGGDFIMIWHNETIGDYGKWEGWKSVLDHSLKA
jgi:hypothetical protein